MLRVAIDIGTTGVRRAIMSQGRVRVDTPRMDVTKTGIAALLQSHRDAFDITLHCTNITLARLSTPQWQSLARDAGCRNVRLLGDHPEESPTLGLARRIALERRLERFAVIDGGASRTSMVLVGSRGRCLAVQSFGPRGDMREMLSDAKEQLQLFREATLPTSISGIGGQGPALARELASFDSAFGVVELANARELPVVGVLLANIVLIFEAPLAADLRMTEVQRCLATLMDDAFEAITREGYDLDDAVCTREVLVARRGEATSTPIACGMTIDSQSIVMAFADSQSLRGDATTSDDAFEFRGARVTAVIEPQKPSLMGIEFANA